MLTNSIPKLAVLTPTGNTGRHVLQTALELGAMVRVLVRDPARLDASVRDRCEIIRGDMRNPADLACLLESTEAAFFCVPQSPEPDDIRAYYRTFTEPFTQAAQTAGLQRIVAISGGDDQGTGFEGIGQALHDLEQTLNATGIATRHLRCGYFMEGLFYQIYPIAQAGLFSLPVAGRVPVAFVAAEDIGTAAAHLLMDRSWTGQDSLAAHGPGKVSCDQAVAILTEVLGYPVRFQSISGDEYKAMITRFGVSDAMGRSLVAMFEAITAGRDMGAPAPRYADCPTTLQTWLETTFKAAINQMRTSATVPQE